MRSIIAAVVLSCASLAAFAGNTAFDSTCAYGLSELGVAVKVDCNISWQDPSTGKIYCFGADYAKDAFLQNTAGNIRKAEAKYAELSKQ